MSEELQDASVDDFGIPVPAVMKKIIDKYVPLERGLEEDRPRCHVCRAPFLTQGGKWGMYKRADHWYCFKCIEEMNAEKGRESNTGSRY